MDLSRRMTIILTAVVTAVTLGVVGAVVLALDDSPTPSIAPMASAETASSGGEFVDPWAAFEERCLPTMEQVWGPTEEELAEIREENERVTAALDEAGVAYRVITEDNGWEHVEPADGDWEAFERVMEEVWSGEEEPGPSEEDLARMREGNQALIAFLDERGIEYEVMTEPDGWEHVEPSQEGGWEAMEEFWRDQERRDLRQRAEERGLDVELAMSCFEEERQLSGMYDGFDPFPLPMDLRMASEHKEMVEALLEAFDEAGVPYQRMDVPFVQWDRQDEAAAEIVERVAEEHGWPTEGFDGGMMMEEAVEEAPTEDG